MNDGMGKYVVTNLLKLMSKKEISLIEARILIMGSHSKKIVLIFVIQGH